MRFPELEFDKVAAKQHSFRIVMQVQELLARHPERLIDIMELETRNPNLAAAVRAYPGVFKVLDYWHGKRLVCFTAEAESLHKQAEGLKPEMEMRSVGVLQKLLMLSVQKQLPLRRIGMLAMDLGLPGDFQQDLLGRFGHVFRLSTKSDYTTWLSLVAIDPELAVSCAELQHKQRRPGMYESNLCVLCSVLCILFGVNVRANLQAVDTMTMKCALEPHSKAVSWKLELDIVCVWVCECKFKDIRVWALN